jgi:7-carboxy-7-deazaguanine synthase
MKINEIFKSIQGEGQQQGEITTFIRTYGCNLRCEWCDTKYAQGHDLNGPVINNEYHEYTVDNVVDIVDNLKAKNICITGGEPLVQLDDVSNLIVKLINKGYKIFVETNGSKNAKKVEDNLALLGFNNATMEDHLHWVFDFKLPSSGMFGTFDYNNLNCNCIYEIKFVVGSLKDYEIARDQVRMLDTHFCDCEPMYKPKVLLSPCWGSITKKELADLMIKDNLNARYSLQIHKVIWNKNKRGV